MKSKNISFAEVLKKNSRSPRMDFTAKNSSLLSLFEEYESNPDQDYTLYLAQTSQSQRGKLKSFQMQQSKFTNEQQQELFDSWIQKQSFMTSNKQNIRAQSKRVPANEQVKKSEGFKRIQPNTRSKGDLYLSNYANSKETERSSKAVETYQEKFTPLHIEMIKSKGYQPNQNLQRATSPKSKFNIQKNISNNTQAIPNRGGNKFNDQKQMPQNNKKSIKQFEKQTEEVFQKPKVEAQSFKSFTKINESVQSLKIQEDISNITRKYMDQKYFGQDQDEQEDEQLLLENSNFPFSRKQSEKTQNLAQKNESNFDKSEEINKKRIEEAKNIIGDYFNYIKKAKRPDQHYEANDYQSNKLDYRSNSNSNNHQAVGYSFSSTFQEQDRKQDKKEAINPIQQLQHENPNESLNDSDFRLKYLNLRSSEAVEENEYIQNIQSVRYDDFSHRDNQINAPYDSFKVKLILSNDKQKQGYKNNQYDISTYQKEAKIETEVKEKDSQQLKKSLESVAIKPLAKSRQKISLISSNKSKASSNKASPKIPINSQKQPEITTTDFNMQTNLHQKKSIENKTYFNQYLETKKEEKRLLIEQKPIYQIKKEEIIPITSPQEPEKSKQQQKPKTPKQQISSIDQQSSTSLLNTYAYSKPAYSGYSTYITSPALAPSNAPTYTSPTAMTPTYATSTPSTSIPTIMKTSNFNSSIERNYYATSNNEPTYGNTTKNQFLGARVYAYSPMKTQNSYTQEYIKEQIKKQNYPHVIKPIIPQSSNSYEQKYALPESFSDKEKSLGKNYLSKLEIKESITLIESKTENQVEYKQIINLGSNKISCTNTFGKDHKYSSPIFSNNGLGSLKQSINVSEGDQFTFDL